MGALDTAAAAAALAQLVEARGRDEQEEESDKHQQPLCVPQVREDVIVEDLRAARAEGPLGVFIAARSVAGVSGVVGAGHSSMSNMSPAKHAWKFDPADALIGCGVACELWRHSALTVPCSRLKPGVIARQEEGAGDAVGKGGDGSTARGECIL